MVNGWRVDVRDASRTVIGQCDVLTTLKATLRHRKQGGWQLDLPAGHWQAALFTPGGGVVVWAPWSTTEPWFSGPITTLSVVTPSTSSPPILTVSGTDDTALLADRLVLPDPSKVMDDQASTAYWTATGTAEWVIRKAVHVNIGQGAITARRLIHADPDGLLAGPGSGGVGSSVKASARFDNLLTFVDELAATDNLTVAVVQEPDSATLTLHVGTSTDRSQYVRLSQPAGTLTSATATTTAPRGTHILVAGTGEGEARTFAEVADAATAAEWRRIEVFRDARDTGDSATLVQRGTEALAELAATGGVKAEPIDGPGQHFGVDYQLGDTVAVDVADTSWTEVVTAVTVDVSAGRGTVVTPVLGDEQAAQTDKPQIYSRVREVLRRLDALERRQ